MPELYTITDKEAGQRLDVFCTARMAGLSRAAIQRAITGEHILLNKLPARSKQVLKVGNTVSIDIPAADIKLPIAPEQELAIPIMYEDRDVVVIDKPAGIAVHHGVGIRSNTIADWFLKRYPDAKNIGELDGRAGIVHRLDKDTSGILILAKHEQAFEHLKKQFKDRKVKKEYLAFVFGSPGGADGRITRSIARSRRNPMRRAVDEDGKEAVTEWIAEKKFGKMYALLRVMPFTGRTHQIRVHLHFLGHPIVGDQLYAFKKKKQPRGVKRQLLHAERLTIMLPNEKLKTFVSPLPEDFARIVYKIEHRHDTSSPKK